MGRYDPVKKPKKPKEPTRPRHPFYVPSVRRETLAKAQVDQPMPEDGGSDCENCGGTGDCPECEGEGVTAEGDACPGCIAGDGQCVECRGDGRRG